MFHVIFLKKIAYCKFPWRRGVRYYLFWSCFYVPHVEVLCLWSFQCITLFRIICSISVICFRSMIYIEEDEKYRIHHHSLADYWFFVVVELPHQIKLVFLIYLAILFCTRNINKLCAWSGKDGAFHLVTPAKANVARFLDTMFCKLIVCWKSCVVSHEDILEHFFGSAELDSV